MLLQTKFVGMMQYDGDLKLPARFLVPPPAISGTSGEILAKNGVSTFACSETQKFGHVSTLFSACSICIHLYGYVCLSQPQLQDKSQYAKQGCVLAVPSKIAVAYEAS